MEHKGILVVVSGFAGAGKGTLMKNLIDTYDEYALSVSATSRQPRKGEVEGEHYFFKTREEFEEMIKNGELLEHAQYVGNYYGTPRAFVEEKLREGLDVILEIEVQGALQVKKLFPNSVLIFVMPPSAAELEKRLSGRGTETEEVINKRMHRAIVESAGIEKYNYVVINDDVKTCTEVLHGMIQAAKLTPKRQATFIKEVREDLRKMVKDIDD
ncbi:MAG: guanylate kinase [Lachnospiraceae bacterium]|nr:guanylate kinase [Lachnospiraceae bacterium]